MRGRAFTPPLPPHPALDPHVIHLSKDTSPLVFKRRNEEMAISVPVTLIKRQDQAHSGLVSAVNGADTSASLGI